MNTSSRSLHFTSLFILAAAAIVASWVRPGHADAPPGRYLVDSGTVVDTKTTLIWEQNPPVMLTSWGQADTYCKGLNVGGAVWRLPSMKELQTIVDRSGTSPTIDGVAFPNTQKMPYWTSSAQANAGTSDAWVVNFNDGFSAFKSKSTPAYARCVR